MTDPRAGGSDDVAGRSAVRTVDRRLVICAIASVAGHLVLARLLDFLPPNRQLPPPPAIVQVHVVEPIPEPPPEPEKPPEPTPEPVKQVHERPRPQPKTAVVRDTPPVDTPPVDHPPTTTDTTTTPVFGVTMESTSQAGNGPAMPVGNTTHPAPTGTPGAAVKPLAQPVAAALVTKMPLPDGRCARSGKYTDEAFAAAVEGVVVLDVTIDEHGRPRDITVVEGLPHGLTQTAIAALAGCRFSPGEQDGRAVAVRVRGYKIRYLLPDAN